MAMELKMQKKLTDRVLGLITSPLYRRHINQTRVSFVVWITHLVNADDLQLSTFGCSCHPSALCIRNSDFYILKKYCLSWFSESLIGHGQEKKLKYLMRTRSFNYLFTYLFIFAQVVVGTPYWFEYQQHSH